MCDVSLVLADVLNVPLTCVHSSIAALKVTLYSTGICCTLLGKALTFVSFLLHWGEALLPRRQYTSTQYWHYKFYLHKWQFVMESFLTSSSFFN